MSVRKINESTLTAIGNAIRAKTGGTALINPEDMPTEIGSISTGGTDYLAARANNTLTSYINAELLTVSKSTFQNATALTHIFLPNITELQENAFYGCTGLTSVFMPKAIQTGNGVFQGCTKLETLVIGGVKFNYIQSLANGCTKLEVLDFNGTAFGAHSCRATSSLRDLILRHSSSLVYVAYSTVNTDTFSGTSSIRNGLGSDQSVSIYIPKVLYDHLGDGSSLDYKSATNWAAYDAMGHIEWKQIEGSIYETQYGDGTPIPT